MSESSSAFITPKEFSSEWRDISLLQRRKHTYIYVASRYGRRFLLKTIAPEDKDLTDFRLQQEQEFQLGIQLVHPNIAATYSLEDVEGVGRCIVQEWIDGITLGEWLQTKPSRAVLERVFSQLLDALEYLHGLQLVHHDLKVDNILITRNGTNVKLIDFGLSALDSTVSPVTNDPHVDADAVCRLFHIHGKYPTIAALRLSITRRKRLMRLLPIVMSIVLLGLAVALFYLSWKERHNEEQRREAMIVVVDEHIAHERERIIELVNRPDSFDSNEVTDMMAFNAYINEYTEQRKLQWAIRDSLAATYLENDILREQLVTRWNHKELELDDEFYPQLLGKLKP